jgi:hypothetical protein
MILNDSLTDRKFITNFDGNHNYDGRHINISIA